MARVRDVIKEPTIQWIAGTVVALATIIGLAFSLDSTYVRAADHKKDLNNVQVQILDNRKKFLDDELFKLDFKSNKSDLDKALVERYRREIREINDKINR